MTRKLTMPAVLIACIVLLSHCAAFKISTPPDYSSEMEPGKSGTTPTRESAAMSEEDQLRHDVVAMARKQIGTKYKYGGTTPKGFDCSGLTAYVLNNYGISLPHISGEQAKTGRKVKLSDVKPGDIIYYKRNAAGKVFHVSLVVNNGPDGITVVHSVSRGVMEENITQSTYWKPKIAGARDVISR